MEDLTSSKEKIQELLRKKGLPSIKEISREGGGKNNKVFSVKLDTEQEIIAKFYFYSETDKRDRFSRELEFLTFTNEIGIQCTPKIIASEIDNRLCLLTKLSGQKLKSNEITENHIDQAANFIINLNIDSRLLTEFERASDGCLTLNEHIELMNRRIRNILELQKQDQLYPTAIEFLKKELIPAWKNELYNLNKKKKLSSEDKIYNNNAVKIILSPSDYGFHNIIANEANLYFLDFEYSGIDDCTKLVCDFLLSPEIPVPKHLYDRFITNITHGLKLSEMFYEHINMLIGIHRIKWACIILNEFTISGKERRSFSLDSDGDKSFKMQLKKASLMLHC